MTDDKRIEALIAARKTAERVVADMDDDVLRLRAFEVTYQSLIRETISPDKELDRLVASSTRQSKRAAGKRPSGARGLIEELVSDGFFEVPRTLPNVADALRTGGHTYRQSDLSKPMLRLTQERVLRRQEQSKDGGKQMFFYERHPGHTRS
jgi:hypothetical protein